jgi:hypothetical protein
MADALTSSIEPVIGTAIEIPKDYWKAYSTKKDVFDRPPPPADTQSQQDQQATDAQPVTTE